MGLFSKLFGNDSVIDAVINTGDALVYTEEEKAKAQDKREERFERLLKLYEPFKIAQRFLALIVSIPFVLLHLVLALTQLVMVLFMDLDTYEAYAVLIEALSGSVNEALFYPFCIIIGFYFAGGAGEGIIRATKNK
ncbi:hypothetical protein AB6E53_02365 [Vibrio breoganii]|uniref:Uncharacterized protein n=1 Tax=Vibrio breoganii TaxID=553239 RepID=A0AAP8MVP6_9VIBR|nr:hypothetical protein [Vibrio breoganii]PMP10232.1 hypothetical protein BCS93_11190 [Vibrio breoganii]